MAFVEKFKAMAVRIENNQPLQHFCQVNFNRTLKVIKVFKNRTEINKDELPIAMLTRPGVNRTFAGGTSKKDQSVFIYFGFRHEDREKAVELSIEVEELLQIAVMTKSTNINDRPMAVMPVDTTTDQGKFHPVHFLVMECLVKDR